MSTGVISNLLFNLPDFIPGQQITCIASSGYQLTEGKVYTVHSYEPKSHDIDGHYTWPAYVSVKDNSDKMVTCHATRFKPVNTQPINL